MTTRNLEAENEQLRRIVDAARNVAFYPPAERGRANKAYVSWMLIDKLRAALSPPIASEQHTFRHKKRGSIVSVVGDAELQSEFGQYEGATLTVYRHVEDGKLWARPKTEFEDGRFERVTSHPRASEQSEDAS